MPEFISDFMTGVLGEGPAGRQGDVANSMMGRYTGVANTYRDQNDAIIAEYLQSLQASQDEYSSNFNDLLQQFESGYESRVADYTQGMDAAIGTYDVGRQNTLQAIDQNTLANQRRQAQTNAFSGLGNTTFGQQAVGAYGTQGAMQKGMVEEQYATGLSALQRGKTEGLANMSSQYHTSTAGLSGGYATQLANMQQGGAASAAGMGMNNMGGWANIMTGGLNQQGQMLYGAAGQETFGEGMVGSISEGLIGGLMGMMFMSDRRLKRDITRVGESPSGLPRYTFRYTTQNDPTLYHGAMAQDVLEMNPEAVQTMANDMMWVRYDLIDVDFYPVGEGATR